MASVPVHHRETLLTVGNRLVPVDFTNLKGLWTFGEGSGTTLYDRSGNGNDGTINGNVWQFNTTRKKYVLYGDGTDDKVDVAYSGSINSISDTGKFTLVGWVYLEGSLTDKDHVFSRWFPHTTSQVLGPCNNGGTWQQYFYQSDGTQIGGGFSAGITAPSLDTWFHLVGRADGSTLNFFVNAVKSTDSYSYDGTINSATAADDDLDILHRASTDFFGGKADLLLWYNDAKSDSWITNHYNKTKP